MSIDTMGLVAGAVGFDAKSGQQAEWYYCGYLPYDEGIAGSIFLDACFSEPTQFNQKVSAKKTVQARR